jgi:hypothetical protein
MRRPTPSLLAIGEVMEGGTVSEVVASNIPRFAKGDIVVGRPQPRLVEILPMQYRHGEPPSFATYESEPR